LQQAYRQRPGEHRRPRDQFGILDRVIRLGQVGQHRREQQVVLLRQGHALHWRLTFRCARGRCRQAAAALITL
jgi:hypothetical protein